jgi:heterodisulfide reductase subunit A
MPKFKMNGTEIEMPEGSTLLQAAKKLEIFIPTLCHHEGLEPYGACRMCTVQVIRKGWPRMVTACNYPCQDDIEVFTDNDEVIHERKVIIELLLARCSTIPILREMAKEYGIEVSRFGEDRKGCILCGLCTRMCREIVGANAISFVDRGTERYVSTPFDEPSEDCIGCGACAYICPTKVITIEDIKKRKVIHNELLLGHNKAIRLPFMQAVPNVPYINQEDCIHFKTGLCKWCASVCSKEAINHDMQETEMEIEVGSVVVATGYKPFDPTVFTELGYGRLPNVITSLEFEKLNNAAGPTGGEILLENGEKPQSVAILHCVGSRDHHYNNYCSHICCMYSLKFSHLVREKLHAEVHELYIDMRSSGKGYEEFYDRIMEEGIEVIRGRVSEVTNVTELPVEQGKLIVCCEDTNIGVFRRIPVDMVILSVALQAREDVAEIGHIFNISRTPDGFFKELHPKLGPFSTATAGIFIAGCCQSPKDIPDTVAQGAAAAAAAISLADMGVVETEPITTIIDAEKCAGCKICINVCPYNAIEFDEEKKISVVAEALCQGCGTCAAACPSGVAKSRHFTTAQILSEIEGVLSV